MSAFYRNLGSYSFIVCMLFTGAVLFMLSVQYVDVPLSYLFCYEYRWGEEYRDVLKYYGYVPYFAALLALVVLPFHSTRRKFWPHVFFSLAFAYIAAYAMKICIVRYRPDYFFPYEYLSQSQYDYWTQAQSAWITFAGWVGFGNVARDIQSFPSAHSTLIWCAAIILCWLHPRLSVLFIPAAIFLMLQRVVVGAHFLSDTIAGATMGVLIAYLLLPRRVLKSETVIPKTPAP